ncbi:MAG: cytochrome C oxidase subunit IV family protein [Patescibacteria group bacterium]|nr:cytochrome C oxidase subunit IV family protein [Patescibacteria group bacterium]
MKKYLTGFVFSVILTLLAFWVVWVHVASNHAYLPHTFMLWAVVAFALVQLVVQLYFFLDIRPSRDSHTMVPFLLALFIIVVVVGGSLWIMQNLSHSQTTPFRGTPSPQNDLY